MNYDYDGGPRREEPEGGNPYSSPPPGQTPPEPADAQPPQNVPWWEYKTPAQDTSYQPPLYSEPAYSEPSYQEPAYREPRYRELRQPESAYTPGIAAAPFYAPPKRAEISRAELQRDDDDPPLYERYGDERPPRRRGGFARTVSLLLVCALIGATAGYGGAYYAVRNGSFDLPPQSVTVVLGATPPPSATPLTSDGGETGALPLALDDGTLSGVEIYKIACNQVVGVSSQITTQSAIYGTTQGMVYGSGFIISEDGYVLTNYHVVEDAYKNRVAVTVTLYDGAIYKAKIVGFDEYNDVAVLKIDAAGLSPVKIGNSAALQVGEWVYAVGNPRRLDYTMTGGIVSALDRNVQFEDYTSINMFQISAAINSGNSGGPVYNERGEVLGIVSAKYSSEGIEGLGFAIPIDTAMRIATDLIQYGYVTGKVRLGITGQTVTTRQQSYYGWPLGVAVETVEPGLAADRAGILAGDTIVRLGDAAVSNMEELNALKQNYKPGDTTDITVIREGATITLPLTFDEDTTVKSN
ncbi:MAG: trypsin-like peptidase domain-containing protein [Oscillospiraceae bacterium]|jgi:serine protease Do|nr:trypsin-like peptidase domain-containing protein [Oscillospiraceae bacterium]